MFAIIDVLKLRRGSGLLEQTVGPKCRWSGQFEAELNHGTWSTRALSARTNAMNPRDLFGVVVRCVGLLALVGSLLYFYSALMALLEPDTPQISSPLSYIGAGIFSLLFSAYFLRGAPHLVRFAYGPERQNSVDK